MVANDEGESRILDKYLQLAMTNKVPGVRAALGTMWPAPISNGVASARPSAVTTSWRAVVMMAERKTSGVQSGCASASSAATPATCGAAIEVPER